MKTLKIFGDIVSNSGCKMTPEDVCLSDVKEFLDTLEDNEPFEVQICSCGGDVYQGIAIYNLIKESSKTHPVTTHVISLAASIASIIACAGEMVIDSNSYLMIHLPFSCGFTGNALEMESEIKNLNQIKDTLISIYKTKFDLSEKEIEDLMIAETWIDASSISDYGINAKVNDVEEFRLAASLKKNYKKFNNLPINIKDLVKMEEKEKEELESTETEEKETVDNPVEEEKTEEVKEVTETVEVEEVKEDTPTEEVTEEKTEEVIEPVEEVKTEEKDECVEEKEEENTQAKIIANYENKIMNFVKELKDKDDEISNLKNEIITIKNNLASLNGAVNRLSPVENKVDWKSLKGEEFFKYLKQHPELTK